MGRNQSIDVGQSNDGPKKHKHQRGSHRQEQPIPDHGGEERFPQDNSEAVRRSRRYYDDSDDMIERVRRVRAAFEKRINGFQGADWPHYVKRTIVSNKKVEPPFADAPPAVTPDGVERKTTVPTFAFPPDPGKERK